MAQCKIISADIDKSRIAKDKLETERIRLAITLRLLDEGVIITDTNQKVLLLNKVAEKLTGWDEEEAIGIPVSNVLYLADKKTRRRCMNPLKNAMNTRGITDFAKQVMLVSRGGMEWIASFRSATIYDRQDSVIGFALILSDITEAYKMEEQMLKAQEIESMRAFTRTFAHDFNNILTAILGNISLAKMYADETKVLEVLTEAERVSMQAKDLTKQLLSFLYQTSNIEL